MYWLTENAFQPMMWGLLFALGSGTFGFVLRKRGLIIMSVIALCLTIGIVVTEQLIVTDSEQLIIEVHKVAGAVTRNDQAAVLACISSDNEDLINRVQREMPSIDFRSVSVFSLTPPKIDADSDPPSAQVHFTSRVNADATQSRYGVRGSAVARVTLDYEKSSDGKWRITNFDPDRVQPNDFFGGSEDQ